MISNIVKRDLLKKKGLNIIILIFIFLATLLIGLSANAIITGNDIFKKAYDRANGMDVLYLFSESTLDKEIIKYLDSNKMVDTYEVNEIKYIPAVYINNEQITNSNYFVLTQPQRINLIKDEDGNLISLQGNEVAVSKNISDRDFVIDDKLIISFEEEEHELVIKYIVFDPLFESEMVSEKMILVSDEIYNNISDEILRINLSVRLFNRGDINTFKNDYGNQAFMQSEMSSIDYNMLLTIDQLFSAIANAIIILFSLGMFLISYLILKFIIITSIEDDYKDIGILKALGIKNKKIYLIYIAKYCLLSFIGVSLGSIISLLTAPYFISLSVEYTPTLIATFINYKFNLVLAIIIYLVILLICFFNIRKIRKVLAIDAIRYGNRKVKENKKSFLAINKLKFKNLNLFLAIKDIITKFKNYFMLFIVYILIATALIIPINFKTTIESPKMVYVFGSIFFDFSFVSGLEDEDLMIIDELKGDSDVKEIIRNTYLPIRLSDNGRDEGIIATLVDSSIETRPYYLKGDHPRNKNEISITTVISSEYDKEVGDTIKATINDEINEYVISGIYQTPMNLGKNIELMFDESLFESNQQNIGYFVILKNNVDIIEKYTYYNNKFPNSDITLFEDAFNNDVALGPIRNIINSLVIGLSILSIFLIISITGFITKLSILKESRSIAIYKIIGFKDRDIKKQYIYKISIISLLAIFIGGFLSLIIGNTLGGALVSQLGLSSFTLEVNYFINIILLPIVIISLAIIGVLLSLKEINNINIRNINIE